MHQEKTFTQKAEEKNINKKATPGKCILRE